MATIVRVSLQIAFISVFSFSVKSDVISTLPEEKECYANTLTFYGDPQVHYDRLRQLYSGCTHVNGNLVLSFLDSPHINYDLSFLENIRYVSGYVAIFANSYPDVVPLPRLEAIRGNETFFKNPVLGVSDVTLLIAVNDHRQIFMPMLREVSSGNVLIDLSIAPNLCYLDTIDWASIVREGSAHVITNNATCPECSRVCDPNGRGGHCWGPADDLCQWSAGPSHCDASCDNRCSLYEPEECCHSQCAVGCNGTSPRHCLVCKDFKLEDGTCVSHCPYEPSTIPEGQNCLLLR